ncbi:uncharacterized protein LOC121385767 [Gigantopelta aegis]|uniref:uncharacterized protein LOC121385767 n=1 Tax=Gigantopelta aegis TaxID=1735272 RepID=UPI001B88ACE1|nr:uncharacterized protein LOC121385767 [Gigantopelta aegis]
MATEELNLVVMNAGGPGNAENRRKGIAKVLKKKKPLLVFMQEFNCNKLHEGRWGSLKVPHCYQCVGDGDVGFVYDTDKITLTRYDNKKCVTRMHKQLCKHSHVKNYAELSRMCIYVMESKGAPSYKLLVISWHGHHKCADTVKEEVVRLFCKFIILLEGKYRLPVIVGGDFNLKATSVEKCLHEDLHVIKPSESAIDMLLVHKDVSKITAMGQLEKIMWKTGKVEETFNHVPLKIAFHPKVSIEDRLSSLSLSQNK